MRFSGALFLSRRDTRRHSLASSKGCALCDRDHEERLDQLVLRGESHPEERVSACVSAGQIFHNHTDGDRNHIRVHTNFQGTKGSTRARVYRV